MERQFKIIRQMADRLPQVADGFETFSEGETFNDGGWWYSCVFRCKPRPGQVWYYRVEIPSNYNMDVMNVERVQRHDYNHTVYTRA